MSLSVIQFTMARQMFLKLPEDEVARPGESVTLKCVVDRLKGTCFWRLGGQVYNALNAYVLYNFYSSLVFRSKLYKNLKQLETPQGSMPGVMQDQVIAPLRLPQLFQMMKESGLVMWVDPAIVWMTPSVLIFISQLEVIVAHSSNSSIFYELCWP